MSIPTRSAKTLGGYDVTLLPDNDASGHPINGFIHWPVGGKSFSKWDRDGGHHERNGASDRLPPCTTFDLDLDSINESNP